MILLALAAAFFVGWNIGANDTANCIGPTVGSGIIGYRQAVLLTASFALLGAVLEGKRVINTVGTGIIGEKVDPAIILVALVAGGLFVLFATIWSMPVSTSQAVIGAIVGIGWAKHLKVQYGQLTQIVGAWIICPFLAMIMSYLLYVGLIALFSRLKNQQKALNIAGKLMVLSSCYVAYSLGANNVGNAVGFLKNLEQFSASTLSLAAFGGLAIAIGALTFGKRVTMTVGKSITPLNVPGALSAQFCCAFGIHIFTILGIPVSTSQAIVGAVLGVGLVHGARAVSKRTLIEIGVGWLATPTLSALFAFVGYKIFLRA